MRIFALLALVCVSLVVASLVALTLPVWLGRRIMMLWIVGTMPAENKMGVPPQITKIHELYTAAGGTYICWLLARATALVISW